MRTITVDERRAFANWARARGAAPNVVAAVASVSWEALSRVAGRLAGYTLHEAFREAEGLPTVVDSVEVRASLDDFLKVRAEFSPHGFLVLKKGDPERAYVRKVWVLSDGSCVSRAVRFVPVEA